MYFSVGYPVDGWLLGLLLERKFALFIFHCDLCAKTACRRLLSIFFCFLWLRSDEISEKKQNSQTIF